MMHRSGVNITKNTPKVGVRFRPITSPSKKGWSKMLRHDKPQFDPDSDDEYDYLKENWVPGDEPMTESQRRENEQLDEEYRRSKW
jgi:hypothetical protein